MTNVLPHSRMVWGVREMAMHGGGGVWGAPAGAGSSSQGPRVQMKNNEVYFPPEPGPGLG